MFRLSLTVLLALSITANFGFTINVFQASTANLQKESPKTHEEPSRNVTGYNSTMGRDQQKVDTTKEQAKKNSSVTSLMNGTVTTSSVRNDPSQTHEETTPVTKMEEEVTKKVVGNFTGEQDNLNQCCVTPPDEDEKDVDATIETPKEKATLAGSTLASATTPSLIVVDLDNSTSTANPTTTSDDLVPPKYFPATKEVISIANVSSDVVARLNSTMYKTVSSDLEDVTEETKTNITNSTVITTIPTTPSTTSTPTTPTVVTTVVTNATIVSKTNQTKNGNSKMAVEGVENLKQAELSEKDKESSDGSKNESMPSGIIALVTAISFAVAIAIGYISMVVWKQYLEHRYGRRELLVNELEFDTNDLRHFEL